MAVISGLDPAQLTVAWAVVATGAALQGSIGFGLGLVAAPLLTIIDPSLIPGPLMLNMLVLTALVTHRERRSVDLTGLQWALSGRLVGVLLAAAALSVLPRDRMSLAIGVVVLLVVAINASGVHVRPGTGSLLGAGFLSGLTGTISSIGGPPMAMLYQDAAGSRLRGTLSGYFMVGVVMSLTALTVVRRFGWDEFLAGTVLVPGMLAGFAASNFTARIVDRGRARIGILTVSTTSGVAVILRSLG